MALVSVDPRLEFDLKLFERELAYLVNVDSGSYCLPGLAEIADWFGGRFERLGWPVEPVELQPGRYGKSLFTYSGDPTALDLLIISHHDTVFPAGTVAERPFRSDDRRYFGPGVADMKAGALMALHALERLSAAGRLIGSVGFFLNAEEEISCPTTRKVIEEKSRVSKVVVSTEPGRADGTCVRQRKGVLRYGIRFTGRAAHSGVEAEKGACAVTEMARVILDLKKLEDRERGITVNPGLVRGGISVNSIPANAECEVDVRVVRPEDAEAMDRKVREVVATSENPRVTIALEGGITRPPMIPNARAEELIKAITGLAAGYGLDLKWSFSGGGSDASFASAMGKAALCGLGPVGGAYHTPEEYVERADLRERLCLFRDTVEAIANGKV